MSHDGRLCEHRDPLRPFHGIIVPTAGKVQAKMRQQLGKESRFVLKADSLPKLYAYFARALHSIVIL
jgi:hypothetical protein